MNNTFTKLRLIAHRSAVLLLMLSVVMGGQTSLVASAQSNAAPLAAPNTLTLNVYSARTEPRAFGGAGVNMGDPIAHFKYILNIDNTGTTVQRSPAPGSGCSPQDAGYPESCNWPSIGSNVDQSPIYSHGDQDDFNGVNGNGLDLPDGRYLISVLADGYKIDGEHFSVSNGVISNAPVSVALQPNPLPDSTLKAFVFRDDATTNGTQDVPAEPGLAGFVGHINDILGEVTTDVYGNPLCTTYVGEDPVTHVIPLSALDGDMLPVVATMGGQCLSDADGILTIPHLGTNRYTTYVIPPDGQTWIQTTTLEGNHDWDTWIMEGSTGFDTEFALAGEPVPQPIFGFVQPKNTLAGGSGHIKGQVNEFIHYTPPIGGAFDPWGGHVGAKIGDPIDKPWLSLADLQAGDVAVYVGQGNADGSFDISGVPDGNYSLSWWDEPQNYNLNIINVTVSGGTVDLGVLPLNGWWTKYEGYIFNDTNRNGVRDSGEPGVPNFTLTLRKRDNTLMDRGQTTVTTDLNGYYLFESAYPLGEWIIMEAYSDNYYTTGVTYQADNQPTPTTVLGAGVDVSVLPIIGHNGTMDWGVHAYDPTGANGVDPRNGGIVGTVSYGTTRNELDPQYLAAEDWQPGISGLPVELWAPVDCGTNPGTPCDPLGFYELTPDGAYAKGTLLNTYVTESWNRPTGCTARDVDGNPLVHGVDEQVLATNQETDGTCIESFMQEIQYAPYPTDQGTPDANFGAAVNGNYGFGDGCFNGMLDATDPSNPVCVGGTFDPLPAGDYLVQVVIPNDASGKPMYNVTKEEDINIGNGDQIIPQVPPPACAGALHTVDLLGDGTDGYDPIILPDPSDNGGSDITVPASTPIDNATFLDIGGSPFEGQPKPLCDTKLVGLNNGKSIVPIFELFTDVPVPARLRGLVVDDTFFSTDPRSTMYGEKAGVPFAPVGVYDFNNRLVTTLESDFNGYYDVLLPSTNHISCPTPSGVCANMYRFVANDPGIPGRLNPNWKPEYRTIATEFEAFPGVIVPTDLAPTQVGLRIEGPAGLLPAMCTLDAATPQLFAVSQPYVNGFGSFTINGLGFGATKGTGRVTLDNSIILPTTSWSDTQIGVTVPAGTPAGPHQLSITAANGQSTVNGLTFHVRGASYLPNVYEVGPGRTYSVIQAAIDAAYASSGDDLVVVYPGTPDLANPRGNPRGAYYENLIIYSPIKLQGVGPGGFQGNTFVPGSIIDGGAFGGDTALATAWFTKIGNLTWDGNQAVNDGEAIYVLASQNANNTAGQARQFTSGFKASIDGFDIRGGDQQGFPGNINDLTGGPTGLPPGIVTQGGAIFANAYARYLQITNNVVQNNGGGYGTIRIGTPDLPAPDTSQHNENVRIANNRIIKNAGTNLAGGIGLFAGADNYEVASNDLCSNYSTEYGGGLSVYGLSPNGKIHHNRIYFNQSNDEGGGIMISGELPAAPGALSPGSGPVDIYNNQIQANMANDDGGGLRFLMAGNFPMNVYNNMIVNNVSTHEGGGISLNDAPNVRIYNNTIMKNLTTSTAVTSNGQPYPAGLSTVANSDQLQATLPGGSSTFSNPLLFNNIFWDNRAGTRAGLTVTGIGLAGDATTIDYWDMGVADGTGSLAPTNSVIQFSSHGGYTASQTNILSDPLVISTYDVSVSFATWAQNPAFVGATLVTLEAPPNLLGDYHLQAGSPAIDLGAASKNSVNAAVTDFDDGLRPAGAGFDSGADEYGATAPPPPPPPATSQLYLTMTSDINLPGISGTVTNDDIVLFNGTDYSMVFDASDVLGSLGGSQSLNGFAIVDANTVLLSFSADRTVPGVSGTVTRSDIVQFTGTLGSNTFGIFSMYFDGSDVSLGGGTTLNQVAETINALDVLPNGDVIVSTVAGISAPGISGSTTGSDLFRCSGGTRGTNTSCAWSWYFDGSDVGLGGTLATAIPESVNGVAVADNGDIYLTTFGTFDVGAVMGNNRDVFVCSSPTTGSATACTYSPTLFFNGSANGLTNNSNPVGGIDLPAGAAPPPPPPPPPPASGTVSFASASLGTLSNGTLDFGSLSGITNQSVITLSVTGAPVVFGSVTVSGSSRFSEVNSGTCQNATVNAGNTCTVIVNFNALGSTLRTGTVTVNYNSAGSPATLSLTGR